jgi:hypothetical protein
MWHGVGAVVMSEHGSHVSEPNAASTVWRPTHVLRGQLTLGALAALAAGGLYVAADGWDWNNGEPPVGLTPSTELNLIALFPQLVVVWVYWGMAKVIPPVCRPDGRLESPAAGFRGGSLCCLGALCVLNSLCLLDLQAPALPEVGTWTLITVDCAALLALALVAIGFLHRAHARPSAISAMVILLSVLGWLFFQVFAAALASAATGQPFPVGPAAGAVVIGAILCYMAFYLWFAFVKVKERRLLGNMAVAVAAVDLFSIGLLGAWVLQAISFEAAVLASFAVDAGRGILLFSWFFLLRERADQQPPRRNEYFWHLPLHEVDWDAENQY